MPKLQNLVGSLAAQDIDQVSGTETLAGAQGCRQRFLGHHRAVPDHRRIETHIAVAAGRRRLAKVIEEHNAAAPRRLAVGEHAVELLSLDAFLFYRRRRVLDHLAVDHHVIQSIGHPRFRRFAVAPGAPGLLIIGFQASGQVKVGNETHVGLVDAHTKSDGGHHHHPILAQETLLVALAVGSRQPRMVGQGRHALGVEPGSGFVDLAARQTIDDSGRTAMDAEKGEQLPARIVALDDGVADVWPVETGNEQARVLEAEAADDLLPCQLVRCRRQGDARNAGEALVQLRELDVLRPEVVPPLRNAMRFVDREQ